MADRALNAAAVTLAVLMPLALGLAVALLTPVPVLAVLELWGAVLLVLGVVVTFAAWMLRRPGGEARR